MRPGSAMGRAPGRGGGPVAGTHFGGAGGGAMRQPSVRAPTGSGMRPGSQMRLGTASGRAPGEQPIGLSTDVDLSHRPVTQQGLTGMVLHMR